MTLANAHALFCGLRNTPSYLANLTIDDAERKGLMDSRNQIRATLRSAAKGLIVEDKYWQEGTRFRDSWRLRPEAIEIKFMTQGSFAYGTLNAPAQLPDQEIDLDDGMYVPVEFLEDGQPALAARALFDFVETALKPLCTAHGWSVIKKSNCVRVKLWDGAHIDIPIYSIPRGKFQQLVETMAKANITDESMSHQRLSKMNRLPSDQVMLARKDGSWIPSDPQQLHEWVQSRKDRYGPVFLRLSRFFKGWRDFVWVKSPLSSLCIMRAVDMALEELDGFPSDQRDDELVMKVAERLPRCFGEKISNPVLPGLSLNEWEDGDRTSIVQAAGTLRDEMLSALERTGDAEQVVRKLRDRFGERIPYRPDAVKIASRIEAIKQSTPATVAAPQVIASTSG
ncbi:MAG: CBASS cGAMP synthase [Hyphomicrobiales bacterium]